MRFLLAAVLSLFSLQASAQTYPGQIPAWNILGNPSGSVSASTSATITSMLDGGFCGTNGAGLFRGASVWACQTTLPTTLMPALTGDVTNTAGTLATTISANAVTLGKIAQLPANTVIANTTSATATPTAASFLQPPTNVAARFGSMDVWQRGAGSSASIAVAASTTAYTVDGCYLATGANQASIVAAVTGIALGSNRAAAITRNSGQTGTTAVAFGCPFDIDEIELIQGSFVNISFTVSTGANWSPTSGNLTYSVFCGTGSVKKQTTGYTGQTSVISNTVALGAGASAQRIGATSAAIVPVNCTQAEIQFGWTPTGTAGAADTVTIDDVQLEVVGSSTATSSVFARLDFSAQLVKAQRHFAKTFPYSVAPAQNGGVPGTISFIVQVSSTAYGVFYRYPQQMRTTPAVITYNPSAANANWRIVSGAGDRTVTVDPDASASPDGTEVGIAVAAAAAVGERLYIHITADAGI